MSATTNTPGRHTLADRIVDDTNARQHAAVLFRHEHLRQLVERCRWAMHARLVGHEPGGIGDRRHLHHGLRAIDEFDQHAHIHVAAPGFFLVIVGYRIDVERVVLALARGNDRMAHGRDEFDQLHARGRLIAGPERIGDAEPVGLALEVRADGHVRLDIHHDEMLAVFHCFQADLGPDRRHPGRIDDHIDQVILKDQIGIIGDGDLAGFHRRGKRRRIRHLARMAFFLIGDVDGLDRVGQIEFGNRPDLDAGHMRHTRDDIGAHLARTDQPDADRTARIRPRLHIPRQSRQCNIRSHQCLPVPASDGDFEAGQSRHRILNICILVKTYVQNENRNTAGGFDPRGRRSLEAVPFPFRIACNLRLLIIVGQGLVAFLVWIIVIFLRKSCIFRVHLPFTQNGKLIVGLHLRFAGSDIV